MKIPQTIPNAYITFTVDKTTNKGKEFLNYIISNSLGENKYEGFVDITRDNEASNQQHFNNLINFISDNTRQTLRLGHLTVNSESIVVETSSSSCGFNFTAKYRFNLDKIRENLISTLINNNYIVARYEPITTSNTLDDVRDTKPETSGNIVKKSTDMPFVVQQNKTDTNNKFIPRTRSRYRGSTKPTIFSPRYPRRIVEKPTNVSNNVIKNLSYSLSNNSYDHPVRNDNNKRSIDYSIPNNNSKDTSDNNSNYYFPIKWMSNELFESLPKKERISDNVNERKSMCLSNMLDNYINLNDSRNTTSSNNHRNDNNNVNNTETRNSRDNDSKINEQAINTILSGIKNIFTSKNHNNEYENISTDEFIDTVLDSFYKS